jgi:hypothetical protein
MLDQFLKACQRCDEVLDLGNRLGRREQEQDRVQVALLGDDPVLAQETQNPPKRGARPPPIIQSACVPPATVRL